MPLWLLLALVVAGIAGIAALTHRLGFSRPFEIGSEDVARAEWLRHWPGDRILSVRIAADRHAALVESDEGPGLLWSFGADTVARRIHGARVRPGGGGLTVEMPDFTAPRLTLALSPDEAADWRREIERMAA